MIPRADFVPLLVLQRFMDPLFLLLQHLSNGISNLMFILLNEERCS